MLLSVPLLAGESVTTADLRVADGRAQINLAPQVAEAVAVDLAEGSPIALPPQAVQWWRPGASTPARSGTSRRAASCRCCAPIRARRRGANGGRGPARR
ncbi:MAG: hypothetical protein U0802_01990 [Candidatus Binatia bacterium]